MQPWISQTKSSVQLADKQGSAKCEAGGRDHLQEALSFSFCGVSCFVGPKLQKAFDLCVTVLVSPSGSDPK